MFGFRAASIIVKRSIQPRYTRSMASFLTNVELPALLTAKEAIELSAYQNVKFLDGSWHLNKARNAREDFAKERIPGAQYIDVDEVCDKTNPLPHMIPAPEYFAEYVSGLGISSDTHVIVYATHEAFSMPRIWWMFRLFSHKRVSIVDGGLPAWKAAGGPIETGPPSIPSRGKFHARLKPELVTNWQEVLDVVNTGKAQILDARSKARFLAQAPEPRPGVAGGHIPGSLSLPFTLLVKPDDVTSFRSKEEIKQAFEENGVILGAKTILSCGSGVTAAVLAFGLTQLGQDITSCPVYDGSWSEWGSRNDLPRIS